MRKARVIPFVILAFALFAGRTVLGQEGATRDDGDVDQTTIEQPDSSPQDGRSSHDESKHLSCQAMCLEDGEDPLDCEQYCIQVADNAPVRVTIVACR